MCLLTGNNQLGQLPTSSQLTEAQVSVFSASGTTQSAAGTSTGTSVNNQSIPGEMYQHPQGTAETTVAYSQLLTGSLGPSRSCQIDSAILLQASGASDGYHQTGIMSPSLYTGGHP